MQKFVSSKMCFACFVQTISRLQNQSTYLLKTLEDLLTWQHGNDQFKYFTTLATSTQSPPTTRTKSTIFLMKCKEN